LSRQEQCKYDAACKPVQVHVGKNIHIETDDEIDASWFREARRVALRRCFDA